MTSAGISNIVVGKANHQVNFIEKVEGVASLRIDTDGHYQKNTVEVVKIVALDANGNPTPAVNFAGTISITAKEGNATIIPDRIAVNDFVNGEATIKKLLKLVVGSLPMRILMLPFFIILEKLNRTTSLAFSARKS